MPHSPDSFQRLPFYDPATSEADVIANALHSSAISQQEYSLLLSGFIEKMQGMVSNEVTPPAWHSLPNTRWIRARLVAKNPPNVSALPPDTWYSIYHEYGQRAVRDFETLVTQIFQASESSVQPKNITPDPDHFSLVLDLRVDQAKLLEQHPEIDDFTCESILPDTNLLPHR